MLFIWFNDFYPNGGFFYCYWSNPLCDGDTASLGLQIESVSDPYTILWEPSAQTFEPIEVHPNITTTYIASSQMQNCVSKIRLFRCFMFKSNFSWLNLLLLKWNSNFISKYFFIWYCFIWGMYRCKFYFFQTWMYWYRPEILIRQTC